MSSLSSLYPGHLISELFVVVAVAVTLLSATAWIVSLFLPRHPAIRHWVLLSALVASLACPLLATTFLATGRSFIAIPWIDAAKSSTSASGFSDDGRPSDHLLPTASEIVVPVTAADPGVAGASMDNVEVAQVTPAAKREVTNAANSFRSTVVFVLLLWLCGTGVSIAWLARGGLHLYRLHRSLQPVSGAELGTVLDDVKRLLSAGTSPRVMVSRLARSPMAAGLFRPVIVLPTGLTSAISREQLRDVLLHEFAHIQRLDCVVVLLQALAKTAFWPILFVHLLNRQLARAREDICDNYVLTCRDAVNYGETLLQLAQLACGVKIQAGTVGILHWRGKLEERILGLIHQGRSKSTRPPAFLAVSVLVLFLSSGALLCGTTIRDARGGEQNSAPATSAEPQTAAPGIVSGEVVQADSGAPVTGATLLLRDLDNGGLRRATTDDMGRFHFKDIPQGQFHIWAFKEPLASPREMIIGQGSNTEAKPRFVPLRLTMSRGKQIKVTVTSAVSGQAIEGAKVELAYPDRRLKVTAKDGTADIQALLPDRYRMTIQATGYARVLRELDLKSADNVTLQSVSLAPGGTIAGAVTDEDQKPLAKASIVFRTQESPVGFYGESPYSDQEGQYRGLYLPLNTPIRISASLKDYVGQEQEVTLTDRQNALKLNFQLEKRPRGASVHGVVTDVLGMPIAGASVGSFGSGPGEENVTTTDPSGRFSLGDVKKNHFGHELIVRAPGFVAARQSFEPPAGMESVAISIKLERGHSIRVRVENTAGEPIQGAFVNVNDAGAPYSLGEFLRTDRDGQFESNSLPRNSTFGFYAPGYSSSEKKQLTLDGKDTVVMTLQPAATLRGKVLDAATGKPIKQFRVRIGFSADVRSGDVRGTYDGELGDPGLTFQSEEGAFTIDEVTSGMPFKVTVEADGYDQGVAPRIVAQAKDIADAVPILLRKREPVKSATLVGKVIDYRGGPISGVQLRLIVSSEQPDGDNDNRFNWALIDSGQLAKKDYVEQYLSTITDDEGRFELKELLPGKYLQLAYWGKKAPKGRTLLGMTEAGVPHSFTLQLPEPAAIRGTFDVETFADAGRIALMLQGQSFHHYDYPLADGKSDFEFEDLPPGTYLLAIMGRPERIEGSPGAYSTRPRATRALTLKPGEEVKVQLTEDDYVREDKP